MKYMGSKARFAKEILPITLQGRKPNQYYVEPFVGGCNIMDKVKGNRIGAEKVLKRLTDNGHQLILFTMRSDRTEANPVIDPTIQNVTGKFLTDAVNWFKENNIPLYGIQKNPTQFNWTTSPKSYAGLMIDDSALGCPLRYDLQVSERPFVDWETVELYLENMGCFN